MNYISCIIQILEIPTIESYDNNIEMVKFRIQLPCARTKVQSPIIIDATIWGDLAYDVANYYRVNDYALIEGYLSILANDKNNQGAITINVTKLYPFLFTLESNKQN